MNRFSSGRVRQKGARPQTRCLAVIVAGLFFSSGCSFIFSRSAERAKASDPYEQTTGYNCSSYAWPVLDTVFAGLNGLGAMSAMGTDQMEWDQNHPDVSRQMVVTSGVLWLGVAGVSAAYGYLVTSKCNEAKAREEAN